MAVDINTVTISGNLTRDPDPLKQIGSDGAVLNFRVAVNERRKNPQSGEWYDHPNFFNVAVFGTQAKNISQWIGKGTFVIVEGKLTYREWKDSKTGDNRSAVDITAKNVRLAPRQNGGGGNGGGNQGGGYSGPGNSYPVDQGDFGPPAPTAPPVADDDIPF